MLLIVEGSNKTGKTTLINEIKKKYNNVFIINNRTSLEVKNIDIKTANYLVGLSTISIIKSILEENSDNIVILDRFHLSELVYGEINRKYINMEMFNLDTIISEIDTKLVLLLSGYNHIENHEAYLKYSELQMKFLPWFFGSKIKNKIIVSLDKELIKGEVSSNTINYIMQ